MIDLERNNKKDPVPAKGRRSRNIYTPNQSADFKLSRTRFSDFLTCKRCFYLDRVKGLKPPGTPGWSLNTTTDELLKKEFDYCRKNQIPHRLFESNGLRHVVPFKHPEMDNWRNSLQHGLKLRYKQSNIILSGGIDDIWQNTITKKLIVVDYKAQSKPGEVNNKEYLEDRYHDGYKIQMDFYAYLLSGMGFDVDETAYFLVCNGRKGEQGFNSKMLFDEYLVPYKWNINWIEEKIDEMIELMNQNNIPESNECCNNCAYSNEYSKVINSKEINDEKIPQNKSQIKESSNDLFLQKVSNKTKSNPQGKSDYSNKNFTNYENKKITKLSDQYIKICAENAFQNGSYDYIFESEHEGYNEYTFEDNFIFKEAYETLKEANKFETNDPLIYYRSGLLIQSSGDHLSSIPFLSRAIELTEIPQEDYYFERGDSFYAIKDYKNAISDFTEAIKISPKNSYSYFMRANAKNFLGQEKDAIRDWEVASSLGSKLAIKMLDKISEVNKKKGININSSKEESNNNKDMIDPGLMDIGAERLIELANNAVREEDYDLGINFAKAACKVDNQNSDMFYKCGVLFKYNIDDYENSIEYFTQAIELTQIPKEEYYYERGGSYDEIGEYENAILDFTEAIKISPKNSHNYLERGKCKEELNDFKGAYRDFQKASNLGNKKATYIIEKSQSNLHKKNNTHVGSNNSEEKTAEELIKAAEQAIEIDSYLSAIKYFEEAIKIEPKNLTALTNIALLLSDQGDTLLAIDYITKAIKINPNVVGFYVQRGKLFLAINEFTNSISDFSKAIDISTHDDWILYAGRSEAKEKAMDFEGAIKDLTKVMKLTPDNYWEEGQNPESHWAEDHIRKLKKLQAN